MKDYKAEAEKRAAEALKTLQKIATTLPVPEGFTAEWTNDGHEGEPTYVMANADKSVRFIFRSYGGGTTEFKLADGSKRTFDRRGVSDSFYWADWDNKSKPTAGMAADLADQLADVKKRLEFHQTAITVPELGYKIAPETKTHHLKELKKPRGYVVFTPAGFGTGYRVSRKQGNVRLGYGTRMAGAELVAFYGVGPLLIETMDCD